MSKKRQSSMDLKQGGRFMHDYSKLFNHLTQYAPNQVSMDDKKNDRFMISLSSKPQERMALNTGGTFLEFVSNVMITDDAIRTHKETKKRKVVVAPSGSAPLKYRMVFHHNSTYPPCQSQRHQHKRQSQQRAPCPYQRAASKALPPPPPVLCLPVPSTTGAALATPASTVVTRATLLESAPWQRRPPLRTMLSISHVVRRR
jgi:hypothetical protein